MGIEIDNRDGFSDKSITRQIIAPDFGFTFLNKIYYFKNV